MPQWEYIKIFIQSLLVWQPHPCLDWSPRREVWGVGCGCLTPGLTTWPYKHYGRHSIYTKLMRWPTHTDRVLHSTVRPSHLRFATTYRQPSPSSKVRGCRSRDTCGPHHISLFTHSGFPQPQGVQREHSTWMGRGKFSCGLHCGGLREVSQKGHSNPGGTGIRPESPGGRGERKQGGKMGGSRGKWGGNGGEWGSSTDQDGKCRDNFQSGRRIGENQRKMGDSGRNMGEKWDKIPIFHSPVSLIFPGAGSRRYPANRVPPRLGHCNRCHTHYARDIQQPQTASDEGPLDLRSLTGV